MKLGDYIHFSYSKYKENGLRPNGGGKPDSAISLANKHKDMLSRLVPKVPRTTLVELEKQLNFFYGNSKAKNSPKMTSEQRNKLQELLLQYLNQHVKNLQDYKIDFSDLSAIKINSSNTPISVQNGKQLQGTQYTWVKAVDKRLKSLQQIISKFPEETEDLQKKLDIFQLEYKDTIQTVKQGVAQNKQLSSTDVSFSKKAKGFSSFIEDLNELLNMATMAAGTQIMGDLAEYVAAIMPSIYEGMLNKGFKDATKDFFKTLDKLVVGQSRSAKVLDSDVVFGTKENTYINKKGKLIETLQLGSYNLESRINYTQDKIDVILQVGDGKPLGASVKNIKANSTLIHLLSGTSLLKYLQLYPEFSNHYLNVTANERIKDGSRISNRAPKTDVAAMHSAMLSTLGVHALVGGLLGKKAAGSGVYRTGKAQVLVINMHGNGRGKFKVYSMSDLLQNVDKNFIFEKDITAEPQQWRNEFLKANEGKLPMQAAYARCINILSQLHQLQLSVSIQTSALKNI